MQILTRIEDRREDLLAAGALQLLRPAGLITDLLAADAFHVLRRQARAELLLLRIYGRRQHGGG